MDLQLRTNLQLLRERYKRMKRWKKLVSMLACIVVFITTYALILPAITVTMNDLDDQELSSRAKLVRLAQASLEEPPELEETETVLEGNMLFLEHLLTELKGEGAAEVLEQIYIDYAAEEPKVPQAGDIAMLRGEDEELIAGVVTAYDETDGQLQLIYGTNSNVFEETLPAEQLVSVTSIEETEQPEQPEQPEEDPEEQPEESEELEKLPENLSGIKLYVDDGLSPRAGDIWEVSLGRGTTQPMKRVFTSDVSGTSETLGYGFIDGQIIQKADGKWMAVTIWDDENETWMLNPEYVKKYGGSIDMAEIGFPTNSNSYYMQERDEHLDEEVLFNVYCFVDGYLWPGVETSHNVYQFKDASEWFEEMSTVDPELAHKMQRLLFAGYPANGVNMFKLTDDPTEALIPAEDYNKLLQPSERIKATFPSLANVSFDVTREPTWEEMALMQEVEDRISYWDAEAGELVEDPELQAIVSEGDFYAAYSSWTTAYMYDGGYELACYLLNDLGFTTEVCLDEAAHKATQVAVWTLMNEAEKKYAALHPDYHRVNYRHSVGNLAENGLAYKLYEYAIGEGDFAHSDFGHYYEKDPRKPAEEDGRVVGLTGNTTFAKELDGKWYAGPMQIDQPDDFITAYDYIATLPDHIRVLDENRNEITGQQINAAQKFYLVSDRQEVIGSKIAVQTDSELRWPSDLYVYQPEYQNGAIPEDYTKRYQNMGGLYWHHAPVTANLQLDVVETGWLAVTKNVNDPNHELADREFTIQVEVTDPAGQKVLNGEFGEMVFKDGVASVTLKANQTKIAARLPLGWEYTISEKPGEDYTATYTNHTGTIQKLKNNGTGIDAIDPLNRVTVTNTAGAGINITKKFSQSADGKVEYVAGDYSFGLWKEIDAQGRPVGSMLDKQTLTYPHNGEAGYNSGLYQTVSFGGLNGKYYVFELDENDQPILPNTSGTVNESPFVVTYETNGSAGNSAQINGSAAEITVTNNLDSVDIPVEKIFHDGNKQLNEGLRGDYSFGIWNASDIDAATGLPKNGSTMAAEPLTITWGYGDKDKSKTEKFMNLPATGAYVIYELDDNGKPVPHETEAKINGRRFEVTYSDDSVTKDNADDGITVTNTVRYVTLPRTGGMGTHLFTIGGLALIASGLLYGFSLRRKRERRRM